MDFSRHEELAVTATNANQDDAALKVLTEIELVLVGGGSVEVNLC